MHDDRGLVHFIRLVGGRVLPNLRKTSYAIFIRANQVGSARLKHLFRTSATCASPWLHAAATCVFFLMTSASATAQIMTLRGPFQPNSGTYTVIPNGSFETGMPAGGPTAPALGTFVRSTQWSERGTASAMTQTLANFTGSGYSYLTSSPVAVQPGSAYVVSGFFYAPTLLAGSTLYIDLNDIVPDADTGLGGTVTHVGQPDVFFCWRLWTAPAGMMSVRPRLVHDGAAGTVGELGFIDDVAVTPFASFVPPVCVWVVSHPTPHVSCVSGQAVFGVVGGGPSPFTYHWRKNTIPIDTTANPSAATSTLFLTNVSASDVASYDCVVTNSCGSITSNPASLSICSADLTCDTQVDDADFVLFATAYVTCSSATIPQCPSTVPPISTATDSWTTLIS